MWRDAEGAGTALTIPGGERHQKKKSVIRSAREAHQASFGRRSTCCLRSAVVWSWVSRRSERSLEAQRTAMFGAQWNNLK